VLLIISPFGSLGQQANDITISSLVSDPDGSPISGATVYGNEGNVFTFTDITGNFTISVPSNTMLLIEAEGYKTRTVPAEPSLNQIVIEPGENNFDVNVAFGKVNKSDLHGAITVINPGDFIDIDHNTNTTSGINGRVAGLLWQNNIWGMENALVMIDGAPRSFGEIMFDEIEQITVLKGVNAVALYGSHAAKGVILITSKRGTAHKRDINIRANAGIATPKAFPKFLNSADYMILYNEARINDGMEILYDDETIENHRSGNPYRYPDIDYYSNEFLRNYSYTTNVSADFTGGNDNATFYSNIGWIGNTSLINVGEGANSGSNRFNIRGNIDFKLNEIISSSVDVSVILNDTRSGLGNYWESAATTQPHRYTPFLPLDLIAADSTDAQVVANLSKNIIDGKYILGGTQNNMTNPFADLHAGGYANVIERIMNISNGIDFDLSGITKGLSFHTKIYADYLNGYVQTINNSYAVFEPVWSDPELGYDSIVGITQYGNDSRPGVQNVGGTAQTRRVGASAQFNYHTTFNDVHSLSAIFLGSATSITNNGIIQPSNNTNLGLQLAYNYDNKYWIDLSNAVLSSTKLPAGNRLGFSPTVSLGWLMSNEDFMAGSSNVDYLKLFASAGILSTDLDINGHYLYENIYQPEAYFSWHDDLYVSRATTSIYGANPNLGFAKRKEVNLGVDALLFNRMLSIQSSVFLNRMDNLPTQRFTAYPDYFRDFVPYENYNSNQRAGIDLMLNLKKQVGEVEFNIGANAVYSGSTVIKRDEIYNDDYQFREGKPLDAIFGLESNGFFNDESEIENNPLQAFGDVKPGDIKYIDQNNDGIIDSKDEVMIGRWIAPLVYALNFSATYKNITLFVQGTGNAGGNGIKTNNYYWVDGDDKYSEVVLDRWTEDTKNTAKYPRLSAQASNNNYRYSDFWLYSNDRFNISKVQITYSMPGSKMQSSLIKNMSIFVNGSNLLTISKNSDILDLSIGGAPQNRYFNIGINTRF
jgi:TonB-linked SusC/RagA family outer membrane protein